MAVRGPATAYHVGHLIDKMNSPDKDFRFMAISDLMKDILSNTLHLSEDDEKKVVRQILKMLTDKNAEIKNLAVKCVGVLTTRVKEPQLESMVNTLTKQLGDTDRGLKDVGSLALKAIVTEMDKGNSSLKMAKTVVSSFPTAIEKLKPNDIARLDVLDIMSDTLMKFGSQAAGEPMKMFEYLINELNSDRQAVRKRAANAISFLVATCTVENYTAAVQQLVELCGKKEPLSTRKAYLLCLTSVVKCNGSRFMPFLPVVVDICTDIVQTSDDDEFVEAALLALDTFFSSCLEDMVKFRDLTEKIVLSKLSHDPNYADDDDDMDVDDIPTDDEDDDMSDDGDDQSWKVRRAAARVLQTIITTCANDEGLLKSVKFAANLVSRMRDREESVRIEILSAYKTLLRQLRHAVPEVPQLRDSSECEDVLSGRELTDLQKEIVSLMKDHTLSLVKVTISHLRSKSQKTRVLSLEILSEISAIVPDPLIDSLAKILDIMKQTFAAKSSSTPRMEMLQLLNSIIRRHSIPKLQPFLNSIVEIIIVGINDGFYMTSGEALNVASCIFDILAIEDYRDPQITKALYSAVLSLMESKETDPDVMERVVGTAGHMLSRVPDQLDNSMVASLATSLFKATGVNGTRIHALRALNRVESSNFGTYAPFEEILKELVPQIMQPMSEWLDRGDRVLKVEVLKVLPMLLRQPTILDDPTIDAKIVDQLIVLLEDCDLHIAQLTVESIKVVVRLRSKLLLRRRQALAGALGKLLQSPALQDSTLLDIGDTFAMLLKAPVDYEELMGLITAPLYREEDLSRLAVRSIAVTVTKVVATLQDLEKAQKLAENVSSMLTSGKFTYNLGLFYVFTLGELGKRFPAVYQAMSSLKPNEMIEKQFDSTAEDMRVASSHALGWLACTTTDTGVSYLKIIASRIASNTAKQYQYILAFKEAICFNDSAVYVSEENQTLAWDTLRKEVNSSEERIKSLVADCYGILCLHNPKLFLPKLQELSRNSDGKYCALCSVKYMLHNPNDNACQYLKECIGDFLTAVNDDDLLIRRFGLITLNSALHNKRYMVRDFLPQLMPTVYNETKVRQDLIHEVEMGPFKHQVDDGLDLRKAAFECLFTLVDGCAGRLEVDLPAFLSHLENGLTDRHHDIRVMSYLMLQKLVTINPKQLLEYAPKFVDHIKANLNAKAKPNAVKQELDKMEELKKSAVRFIHQILKLAQSEKSGAASDLALLLKGSDELSRLSEEVKKENIRAYEKST